MPREKRLTSFIDHGILNFVAQYAFVAELADALDSGSSGVTAVEVRVLSSASNRAKVPAYWLEPLCVYKHKSAS
jgi:hypothetical protein